MIVQPMKSPVWDADLYLKFSDFRVRPALDLMGRLDPANGGATVVIFAMKDEDVRLIARQPFVATASDGRQRLSGNSQRRGNSRPR